MKMRIALMAAVNNQWESVIPWIAHHLIEGFGPICLADIHGRDGTGELLELLATHGWIHVVQAPERGADLAAKSSLAMAHYLESRSDAIAQLDVNEYAVSHDDESVVQHLARTFSDYLVGAIAINTRTFGSRGQRLGSNVQAQSDTCNRPWDPLNRRFKVVSRNSAVTKRLGDQVQIGPRHRYLHIDGTPVKFLDALSDDSESRFPEPSQSFSVRIVMSPVTIHCHYFTRRMQFQLTNNAYSQAQIRLVPTLREGEYFERHQFNIDVCAKESHKIDAVRAKIEEITLSLVGNERAGRLTDTTCATTKV